MTEARQETPAQADEAVSFGRRLAAERERQGLSVIDMAARLRLHPRQIEAIEQEAVDRLPSGPFVRGFIRNYARELKLDPVPLLASLSRRAVAPAQVPAGAEAAGAAEAAPIMTTTAPERISRRLVIMVALGALLAFALIGTYTTRDPSQPPLAAIDAAPPTPARPPEGAASSAGEADAPAAMAQAGSSATDAGPGAGAFPASTESAEPVAASPMPESPAPVAAAAADPGRAKAAGALRFVFDEESWVEVIQADGRVLMSQINPAGTERTLAGDPPLKVVIGNASAVTVEYRGKRVDLAPRTSIENVARLTLD